uniref:AB hydrolase-1 domain-containing protein n=1 Tax=Cairina moschata TaxID=8855 RepID=A0A8C3C3P0_CAIMO
MGQGPPVCLCHGFPEVWLSWRYQIPALADAGFRVIALEMKGYGESTAPLDIEEYSQEQICKVRRCGRTGEYGGGAVVGAPTPGLSPCLWGMAGALSLLRLTFCPSPPAGPGGLLVGFPENPPESLILHGPELQYYVQCFQKSGFRGPLNWYRNMRPNWRWALTAKDRKILMPALMVTAGKDVVLHPSMSKGMEEWVPQLRRGHLEECGHWTQMERPAALNKILVEWLEGLPPDVAMPRGSRL